ncbi:MAG: hypothetical protein RIG82_10770 [Phycisphaeraceae bacterium]
MKTAPQDRPGVPMAGPRWLLLTLLCLPLLAGCSFGRKDRLDQHLRSATTAIQSSNLEGAKAEVAAAADETRRERERAKVASLAYLIAGSEAMMQGDGRMAGAYWSNIPDPKLRQQVAQKAERLTVQVPANPVLVPLPPHHDGRPTE